MDRDFKALLIFLAGTVSIDLFYKTELYHDSVFGELLANFSASLVVSVTLLVWTVVCAIVNLEDYSSRCENDEVYPLKGVETFLYHLSKLYMVVIMWPFISELAIKIELIEVASILMVVFASAVTLRLANSIANEEKRKKLGVEVDYEKIKDKYKKIKDCVVPIIVAIYFLEIVIFFCISEAKLFQYQKIVEVFNQYSSIEVLCAILLSTSVLVSFVCKACFVWSSIAHARFGVKVMDYITKALYKIALVTGVVLGITLTGYEYNEHVWCLIVAVAVFYVLARQRMEHIDWSVKSN